MPTKRLAVFFFDDTDNTPKDRRNVWLADEARSWIDKGRKPNCGAALTSAESPARIGAAIRRDPGALPATQQGGTQISRFLPPQRRI
jgi:hypothetical protein